MTSGDFLTSTWANFNAPVRRFYLHNDVKARNMQRSFFSLCSWKYWSQLDRCVCIDCSIRIQIAIYSALSAQTPQRKWIDGMLIRGRCTYAHCTTTLSDTTKAGDKSSIRMNGKSTSRYCYFCDFVNMRPQVAGNREITVKSDASCRCHGRLLLLCQN